MKKIRGELLIAAGAFVALGTIGAADTGNLGAAQIVLQTAIAVWFTLKGVGNMLRRLCRSYARGGR